MIFRKNYRACLSVQEGLQEALEQDKTVVKKAIEEKKCLTVALYRHENMLFLYMEAMEEGLEPQHIFPQCSKLLAPWPKRDGFASWAKMYPIFYHDLAQDEKGWARKQSKKRRGRIAYLKEEKLFSYVYHHKALVDEGLLEGDRYQFIALHEDILFSYFEEPKELTHIRQEVKEESQKIQDWLAVDPESHFDHTLSGEENFLLLPEVFSMGAED